MATQAPIRGSKLRYPLTTPPESGQAVELAEGVLWMRLPLPMALDHVNVYAFEDPDGWTIVDTGMDTKRTRGIWADLLTGPLAGRPVARVLATHHHPDHIGLAGWFQAEHGAELLATRTSWLFARMLRLDEQAVPPPETLAFWRSVGMDPDVLAQRATERPFNYADIVAPMPLGFRRLQEDMRLRLAGRDWIVRLGNGHAPDQVTLWCEDDPLVLGADQLLPSISPNIGVYVTEPNANPLAEWMETCTRFEPFARDDQLVLPGHKLPFQGLPVRLRQFIENHDSALDRLRAHLSEPRSAGECFAPLYRRAIGAGEYGLALVEAVSHINYLADAGEIVGTDGPDGVRRWQMR